MHAYTYTLLRYVHDTTTGEFLNVGVVLYCPELRFVDAKCRKTYGRLMNAFPSLQPTTFKSALRHVEAKIGSLKVRLANELPVHNFDSVMNFALGAIPQDDSSLQWSKPGSGITNDPERTLDALFDRMVRKYDEAATSSRRTEEDVWRKFKRDLEDRQLLSEMVSKTILVKDDSIEFQHAWKNGIWHCVEPVSFDLSSDVSIREKAHKWLGQLASVKDSPERFKVYLVVGAPQNNDLNEAFGKALSILRKVPVENEIYLESQTADLSRRLSEELNAAAEQRGDPPHIL